ncbi:WAT1-related protein At4g30420 [Lathyrus oleraceus]|uniref:WAT1-related protein At4g30420 n=1 Tax=Pisum sativum TaxID=3888 RepID=UPI0021D0AEA3|nr:WAT1-related protein At4g30420-like [Pisum sativum]
MEYYLPIMVMLFLQFIFAGMTLGTRIALLEGLSPRVFVVYRSAFATIVLAPLAYLSSRRNSCSCSLNLRSFCLIFIASLIGITLYQNLYFEGLYLASSSVASAISNLLPAITFVIAAFVGMERVNIRSLRSIAKIVGTIICVTGAVSIALLKGPKLLNAENLPSKSFIGLSLESDENWLLGCLFLLGSIVAWSIFLILQVPAYESHPNYISLSAWLCFMATLQSAVVTLFIEQDLNAWKITSILELGCSLYAGIMGSAVTFCLQAWCISRRGPLFYAMFIPVFTIICTVLAALLLHEEIYIGSLIGAIGVIIGLSIVLWGKAKDIVDVKEKTDSKSMINEIEEVKFLINESYEKEHSKSDLKEPLLPC